MVHALIRRMALLAPPVRRLVQSRDALLVERDALIEAASRSEAEVATPVSAPPLSESSLSESPVSTRGVLGAALNAATPGSFLSVSLNGASLDVPVETLRTMVHCIHIDAAGQLQVWVETEHLRWMMARLRPGATFLDVGAATGATTLPIAAQFGPAVRILAFEPASAARALLHATLERNHLDHVEVRPVAVSDQAGIAEFLEYLPDETGQTPWMPETSTLAVGAAQDLPSHLLQVEVVTLDAVMAAESRREGGMVVKIDVEGFESHVLRGAAATLRDVRPHLAIDIHVDPEGDGQRTTEDEVRALLAPHGYRFRREAHVLLCESPSA